MEQLLQELKRPISVDEQYRMEKSMLLKDWIQLYRDIDIYNEQLKTLESEKDSRDLVQLVAVLINIGVFLLGVFAFIYILLAFVLSFPFLIWAFKRNFTMPFKVYMNKRNQRIFPQLFYILKDDIREDKPVKVLFQNDSDKNIKRGLSQVVKDKRREVSRKNYFWCTGQIILKDKSIVQWGFKDVITKVEKTKWSRSGKLKRKVKYKLKAQLSLVFKLPKSLYRPKVNTQSVQEKGDYYVLKLRYEELYVSIQEGLSIDDFMDLLFKGYNQFEKI